jgi:3-phosphoshikimate 1-carboxyvinyltransferase
VDLEIEGGYPLKGKVRVPADKSILHRSLMCAAMATGTSRIMALKPGQDTLSTADAICALGVKVRRSQDGFEVDSPGLKHWRRVSNMTLDCGNSGTTMRLLAGLLTGAGIQATLTGDNSLSKRPMGRICEPLRDMGGAIRGQLLQGKECAPLVVEDGPGFQGGKYESLIASAQVKSALLLAGVASGREVRVIEPHLSRDHSRRLLSSLGVDIASSSTDAGYQVAYRHGFPHAGDWHVPGDLSSATFLMAAASLVEGSELLIEDVGLNPTRIGFVDWLRSYGAKLQIETPYESMGEPVGHLRVAAAPLSVGSDGFDARGAWIPKMIDELMLVGAVGSQAQGQLRVREASELRVKESDRIKETQRLLAAFGVACETCADGFIVDGPQQLQAAVVDVGSDHRVALTAIVLALATKAKSRLRHVDIAAVSYPDVVASLQNLGARMRFVD